jgi:MFS family permease
MTLALYLGLYVEDMKDLYYITILVGSAYGGVWTIIPTLVGEYFSLGNFSNIWGWFTAIPGISGYSFGFVFGYIYERESVNGICKGVHCFYDSFMFSIAFCCLCIVANIILFFKKSYNQ